MLPDRCVGANIDAIIAGAQLTHADRAVSWLPLYHDMGLIGLLMAPMLHGFELVLGAPQDFLARPACWLEWISEYRGTITAGPNFSYALAARALRRADALDLSSWRLALNGAETVDPHAVESFCAAAAPFGFDARAAYPVFGMAEATLAVTFPAVGDGMTVDAVDRHALEHDRRAVAPAADASPESVRRLAKLGRPLDGFELRIVDPATGAVRAEREVGELELRSPSVTPGYYRNAEATAATFDDGWLRTGDLAYLVDGELVVCGRQKDVIIVGGRNVFPEDVERAAATVEGVRAGNVIAFGSDRKRGRESIVVVAETKTDDLARGARLGRHEGARRGGRPTGRGGAREAGLAAQDLVGEVAAVAVPRPLPREPARTGVTLRPSDADGQLLDGSSTSISSNSARYEITAWRRSSVDVRPSTVFTAMPCAVR